MWRWIWLFSAASLASPLSAVCATPGTAASSTQWQQYVFNAAPTPPSPYCPAEVAKLRNAIYVLYDVNRPEGFNLRRDVYIRLAVFVRKLRRSRLFRNVRLVLPPWRRLYHWKSIHLPQDNLPWSAFFDVGSMQRYAPVLDFPEFLQEIALFGLPESPYVPVHKVYQLRHFEEMFENGQFYDKFEFVRDCPEAQYGRGGGYLLQQSMLLEHEIECLRFQGSAHMLERVLRHALNQSFPQNDDPKIFALLNAEIVLHDQWGDYEFWRARRSMRFAAPLVAIADQYRLTHFNSTNAYDKVQRPPMWELERAYRAALGGPYLCAHLRRGDFTYGRDKTTPTLKSAATQLREHAQAHNLTKVFLATDATAFEVKNIKSYMQRTQLLRFSVESLQQKAAIKDGGIAIVDQLICAHAQHFLGTYESTFTYRIYEEREILGFSKRSTFNTLCKSETQHDCAKNSIWPIAY